MKFCDHDECIGQRTCCFDKDLVPANRTIYAEHDALAAIRDDPGPCECGPDTPHDMAVSARCYCCREKYVLKILAETEAARLSYARLLDCEVGSIHAAIRGILEDNKYLIHNCRQQDEEPYNCLACRVTYFRELEKERDEWKAKAEANHENVAVGSNQKCKDFIQKLEHRIDILSRCLERTLDELEKKDEG